MQSPGGRDRQELYGAISSGTRVGVTGSDVCVKNGRVRYAELNRGYFSALILFYAN
jgi:hypothetical protein